MKERHIKLRTYFTPSPLIQVCPNPVLESHNPAWFTVPPGTHCFHLGSHITGRTENPAGDLKNWVRTFSLTLISLSGNRETWYINIDVGNDINSVHFPSILTYFLGNRKGGFYLYTYLSRRVYSLSDLNRAPSLASIMM